jgi:hypothetical protein
MDTIPDCWLHGEGVNHYLGWYGVDISTASNNYDMIVTGTENYPNGFPGYRPGKVYVLFGDSPMDTIVDLWKVGETDSSWLGIWVVGTKIDYNTMYGNFLAGAPIEYQFDGRGYLWLGNTVIDSIYDGYLQGIINYYGIGWQIASAGDVNGDSYDEVMFSNYAADSNQSVWVCMYTGPGIEEQRAKGMEQIVKIWPNPFSGNLIIRCSMLDAGYLMNNKLKTRIFDVTGREIIFNRTKDELGIMKKGGVEIDTKDLPAGVYFVQVEVQGIKEVRKAIKIE